MEMEKISQTLVVGEAEKHRRFPVGSALTLEIRQNVVLSYVYLTILLIKRLLPLEAILVH